METLDSGEGEACGGGPVAAVMMAAKRLGGSEVKFIDYTTSGETTGQFEEVVGYLSAVVVAGKKARVIDQTMGSKAASKQPGRPPHKSEIEIALTAEVKVRLLEIAHEAVAAHLNGKEYKPEAIEGHTKGRGLFVTLHQDHELRGCIGRVRARSPLHQTVAEMALASAFEDPRFDPVGKDDLQQLSFEISVLSPLKKVRYFDEVEVGRDGLMVKLDLHSGLLLPQVATENGWDRTEFLEQTCLKAGLPKKSYLSPQAEVYRFSAEVFSDDQ
jgi:AmmeMemoRadiSam system protein A